MDVREPTLEERRRVVGHVEPDAVLAGALHLVVDGARHDVTRGEVGLRVVLLHERGAVLEAQHAALAAQGLADEKALGLRVVEHRRMELVELHVRDLGARAVGHRDAVARRDVGVRRVQVHLARAAGGQHGLAREQRQHRARPRVEHVGARTHVGPAELRQRDEVHGHVVLEEPDARVRCGSVEERSLDLPAGDVARVHDASRGVASLASELERRGSARGGVVELRPERLEVEDALWGLAHDALDDVALAQPRPGHERVFDVRVEAVRRVEDRGDATLGPRRVGFLAGALGDDGHLRAVRRTQREGEPRHAAPEHQDLCLLSHFAQCGGPYRPCAAGARAIAASRELAEPARRCLH